MARARRPVAARAKHPEEPVFYGNCIDQCFLRDKLEGVKKSGSSIENEGPEKFCSVWNKKRLRFVGVITNVHIPPIYGEFS
ncbi:MAG: hypothetical protein ACOYYS_08825 [Chloroflexota bacterium]